MKTKAGLYIRVSTDAQAEEGYSIDAQKEMLTAFCVTKNIKDYELYIDGGFTGSNIERPGMRRLIDDVKKGIINIVVVYKLDRLSRSQKDTLYLIEDVFNLHKTEFVSLNENLDTSTPIGRAMLGIMSAFAQLERETIRERTRMGMKERVKSGLWMGGGRIPFGYDYDKATGILIKNKDAETVKKVYDLYLQGYSMQKVANIVGLKYDKLAMQILTRKTNAGYIVYNNQEYLGKHEPIISLETYNQAMEQMKERSVKRVVTSEHYLQGLIYCGKCGAKMRYQKWGKTAFKIYCYSQQTSKKYLIKDPDCDNKKLWADDIEDIVVKDLMSMSWEKAFETNSGEKSVSPLELLQHQYRLTSEKLKKLYNLYAEAGDEVLIETIEDHKKEMNRLHEQMIVEQNKNEITNKIYQTRRTLKNLSEMWEYMTFNERQNLIRNVVEKIVITDDNVEIFYRFVGNNLGKS